MRLPRSCGLRELGRLGGWMFCYVAVSQVGVCRAWSTCSTGPPATDERAGPLIYNNVFLLLMMAHGIIAVSIITALMPRMSAAAADGRFADVAADLSRGTRLAAGGARPDRGLLRGARPARSRSRCSSAARSPTTNAPATGWVLAGRRRSALVPFAISQLFTFAFYALPDTQTPALINIPVVALRIAVQIWCSSSPSPATSPRPG